MLPGVSIRLATNLPVLRAREERAQAGPWFCCVTLSKSSPLSEPQSPHLEVGPDWMDRRGPSSPDAEGSEAPSFTWCGRLRRPGPC